MRHTAAVKMAPAVSIGLSIVALLVSLANAWIAQRLRQRQERAAVTADLYPVLRALRDNAQQFGKPLGGKQNEHLIALHYNVIDLNDLTPAIADKALRQECEALLRHPAVQTALLIDPPRFVGVMLADSAVQEFSSLAQEAHSAVKRCQTLRRGSA